MVWKCYNDDGRTITDTVFQVEILQHFLTWNKQSCTYTYVKLYRFGSRIVY